ncbi:MAG: hypothetical protein ACXADB_06700 [Candidatus Hermodarchaeia archaeon]
MFIKTKKHKLEYIQGAITLTTSNLIAHWKKYDFFGVGYRIIFIRKDARRGYDMVCPEAQPDKLRLLNGAKSIGRMNDSLGSKYREQRGTFMNLWFCLRALFMRLTLKEQQVIVDDLKNRHHAWIQEEWVN